MKKVKFSDEILYYDDKVYYDNIDVDSLSSFNIKSIFIERFLIENGDKYKIKCLIDDINIYCRKMDIDIWKMLSKVLPYMFNKINLRVDVKINFNYIFTKKGLVLYTLNFNRCIFDLNNVGIDDYTLFYEIIQNKLTIINLYKEIFENNK
jgi:hypothetical protein